MTLALGLQSHEIKERHIDMTGKVFVSHSSEDAAFVKMLAVKLASCGVEVWASSLDVRPGQKWDHCIEESLDAASHVLVIVSKYSVHSSYVRAEVEYALNKEKTVIPVLIENVDLPLRWRLLQAVCLSDSPKFVDTPALVSAKNPAFLRLLQSLPSGSRVRFRQHLQDGGSAQSFRELLWKNPHWLGFGLISKLDTETLIREVENGGLPDRLADVFPDFPSCPARGNVVSRVVPRLKNGAAETAALLVHHDLLQLIRNVDFIEAQQHSQVIFELVFLCSTHDAPFDDQGEPTPQLRRVLSDSEGIVRTLVIDYFNRIPKREGYPMCWALRIDVLAGQRQHYDSRMQEARLSLCRTWAQELLTSLASNQYDRINLEMPTYTRLLDKLEGNAPEVFSQ